MVRNTPLKCIIRSSPCKLMHSHFFFLLFYLVSYLFVYYIVETASHKQTKKQSEFYFLRILICSIVFLLFNLIRFIFNVNKQQFFLNNHLVFVTQKFEKNRQYWIWLIVFTSKIFTHWCMTEMYVILFFIDRVNHKKWHTEIVIWTWMMCGSKYQTVLNIFIGFKKWLQKLIWNFIRK